MKTVTADQMRALDRRTIDEAGVPGAELMERAAQGIARTCRQMIRAAGWLTPRVRVVAGKGNNGGDGFGVARILHDSGCRVDVWLCGSIRDVRGDAAEHLEKARALGVPIVELPTAADWAGVRATGEVDLLVDALLGTGFTGVPRAEADAAIAYIQRCSEEALVVAVDVPSGFPADTGIPEGRCVAADRTVTLGAPKSGLLVPGGATYLGSVDMVDIGIPAEFLDATPGVGDAEMVTVQEVRGYLSPIDANAHKTQLGRVLLIGGSRRYVGAIALAARAAVRMGAGLTHVLVPESIRSTVAASCPEAMVRGLPETDEGVISSDAWPGIRREYTDYQACLVGPGLTDGGDPLLLVTQIIREGTLPLVLDADAINVLAGRPEQLAAARAPLVLTPHPGEFARLMQLPVTEVQDNRVGMSIAAAKLTDAVLVLKGPGTVIAEGDRASVNLTGNAGLATGGSGDVLAGMIVALLGRGCSSFAAATSAVWLHGRTADLVATRCTRAATRPTDLIEGLPLALKEVRPR